MFKRLSQYYTEVKSELKKSTFPKPEEVKNTTIVVIITVLIFAFYLYLCDISLSFVINNLNDFLLGLFS
jgi:preprotein translocase SecE subunit